MARPKREFTKGQKVVFMMYDSLFKSIISATGTIVSKVYGKIWLIKPDKHEILSGSNVQAYESYINGR